jgi:translocation and assembly module TamB
MASRALKIAGIALVGLLILLVAAIAALFVLASSEGARDWVLAKAKEELAAGPGLELNIGAVQGSLLSSLQFQELSLSHKGRTVFKVREAELGVHLLQLMGGRLKISPLRLVQPELSLPLGLESPAGGAEPPPLAISVSKIDIKDGLIRLGGLGGPLREVAAIQAQGRFVFDLRGMRGNLNLKSVRLGLEQGSVQAAAQAVLSGEHLEISDLRLASGPNNLLARAQLSLSPNLAFTLRARGHLAEVAKLPLVWPGPRPPQAPLDFNLHLQGDPQSCRVIADLELGGGRVDAAGLVNLTGLDGNLTLNFQEFDPQAWGLSPLPFKASGRLQVSSHGKPGAPEQQASLKLALSHLAAFNSQTKQLKLRADLAGGVVKVQDLAAAGDWGSLVGSGSLSLPRGASPLGLEANISFQELTPPPALAKNLPQVLNSPRLSGKLEARGDVNDLSGSLALVSSHLTKEVALDSLSAQGGLRHGSWWLSALQAKGAWGEVSAQGTLDEKQAALDFELRAEDLARVSQALTSLGVAAPELGGSLQASGSLRGDWPSPKWELRVGGRELSGFESFMQEVKISAQGESLWPLRGKAVLLAAGILSGEQNWEKARLELSAGRTVYDFNLQAHNQDGWDLSLSADSPAERAMFEAITLRRMRIQKPGLPAWVQQGTAVLALGKNKLSLAGLSLKSAGQSVSVSGGWRGSENVKADLQVQGLKLKPFWPEQVLPDKAELDAKAQLSGSLSQPVMSLQGKISGLTWPGLPPSEVEFNGQYQGQTLELAGRALTSGQPSLDLKASLGIELSLHPPVFNLTAQGLTASADSDNFPLAILEPLIPGLSRIKGKADMQITAKGSLEEPYLSGGVRLDKAAFTVAATGQRFRNVQLWLRLKGRRVTVESAQVQSGGDMRLSGWFDLPGTPGGRLAVNMETKKFDLSLGVLGKSLFDAELKFKGSWQKPLITGIVKPAELTVQVGMSPPSDLEEEVVVMKPGQKPPPMEHEPSSLKWVPGGFLGLAEVDLEADLGKGLKVNLEDGWLVAVGAMHLKKEPKGPFTYHGIITVNRGLVLLLGKRFEINNGKLDFAGRDEPNPIVDAAISLRAGKVLAQISVTGDAMNPHVQMSSEPPMSQADILSTIVFGRTSQNLDQGQSDQLNAQALALLGQQGAREIGQILSPQLAPDVVTVYQEAQYGSSLEAGKYLSPDLYLRYRHNLSSEGGQNVGLEYRIYDWLSLESQVGDARDSGVDMVYSFDFSWPSEDK